MRVIKTFTIPGGDGVQPREVTVRELTVREIMEFIDPQRIENLNLPQFIDAFRQHALPRATSLKPDDLLDMTPSELDHVWQKFREVNSVFFGLSERLGLNAMWDAIKPKVLANCGLVFVDLLNRVMVTHLTTASGTSSTP